MSAEGRNGGLPAREDTTREHSFDELAKGLASGSVSRRQVLRWMGAAIAGTALVSVPGVAWATHKAGHGGGGGQGGGGNSACAKFCTAVFDETEPAHSECTSAAAQNKEGNLCQQCLADPTRICPLGQPHCCPGGLTECCGPTACCDADQNCCPQEDRCVTCREDEVFVPATCQCECPPGTEECGNQCRPLCPTGQRRNPTTCQCEVANTCTRSGGACAGRFPCGPNGLCQCFQTTEGVDRCFTLTYCSALNVCTSSSECPPGFACSSTCCGRLCYPLCGTPSPAPASVSLQARSSQPQDLRDVGISSG